MRPNALPLLTAAPCRSRGVRLQHHVAGRSHRWLGAHLREEHPAARSRHPGRPAEGGRQAPGGQLVRDWRRGGAKGRSLSQTQAGATLETQSPDHTDAAATKEPETKFLMG